MLKNLDLTNSENLIKVQSLADSLYEEILTVELLQKLEKELTTEKNNVGLSLQLAVKIALSKRILSQIKQKIHLTVVFAIYKEHTRILTGNEHEHGEDFLMRKIEQMKNLTKEFPNITWDMLIVDDGCPEKSGKIAQQILKEKYSGDNVKVLFLKDAIEKNEKTIENLKSTNESRKGASIEYGMYYATKIKKENHIIIFTDADLSTHLGQCGLLVDGIINRNKKSGIASRREPASVVVKKGTRNTRGKLFIYLWKRMISPLNYIVDTQCGFKAFKAETVNKIILDNIEKKFAFDIELLLKTDLLEHKSIEKVPVAWIDSEAASTTTDIQPYLSMLKSISEMYKKYLPQNNEADDFAELINYLSEEKWNKLLENIPKEIAEKEPYEFDLFNDIKASKLQKICN